MCKPTTVRQGDVYMCSLDTGSVFIYAYGDTSDAAYAAWVDKLVCRVNQNEREAAYLQHKIDAAHYQSIRDRYNAKVSKASVIRRVMNYFTGQDSIV